MRLRNGTSRWATLAVLCERRIGHPVIAAARMRVDTAEGKHRTRALAIAADQLWWLELSAWQRRSVGRVLAWRPLDGLAVHTEQQRGGGYVIELSWPALCELYTGRLVAGTWADDLVGHLTTDAFARASRQSPH